MIRDLLKKYGVENDQAYSAILSWFSENRGRRVNSNELSLMGFRRFSKGRREWVAFSAETIARKARQLGEWELLARGHDSQGHTWYEWKESNQVETPKKEFKVILRDGRPIAVYA